MIKIIAIILISCIVLAIAILLFMVAKYIAEIIKDDSEW